MVLEDLATGTRFPISAPRGAEASGCILDASGLAIMNRNGSKVIAFADGRAEPRNPDREVVSAVPVEVPGGQGAAIDIALVRLRRPAGRVEAEKRGQGEAIAKNIMEFMTLKTPVISIILGEGGSGGALALAVCDELAMLENAIYSVISPRGFASILWKDSTREREACDIMKITAEDLTRLGVCDHIISEADGGAHNDPQLTAENISDYIEGALKRKLQKGLDELLEGRYNKFRTVGEFEESSQE